MALTVLTVSQPKHQYKSVARPQQRQNSMSLLIGMIQVELSFFVEYLRAPLLDLFCSWFTEMTYLGSAKMYCLFLFVNDTCLVPSHENFSTLMREANEELSSLSKWFQMNELSLNIEKSDFMIVSNKNKKNK